MESFYSGVRHASEEDLEMKNLDDYAAERLIKPTWEKKGGTKVTGVVVKKKRHYESWIGRGERRRLKYSVKKLKVRNGSWRRVVRLKENSTDAI